MGKYIVEFLGTFFLVFTMGMTASGGLGPLAPLAVGSALMVMVYAGSHISGGHYNPAVTFAFMLRGKCPSNEAPLYMLAQFFGAMFGALLSIIMLASIGIITTTPMQLEVIPALVSELLGSFMLVYVYLFTTTSDETKGNSFFGLAIGFTLVVTAISLSKFTVVAFNPAAALGLAYLGNLAWQDIWLILLGNFAGGVFAAAVYQTVNSD